MTTIVARISPDRPAVAYASLVSLLAVMVAAWAFSFVAITDAAGWAGVPAWAQPLAAAFIDGAILVYTLTLAIHRWRGDSTWRTNLALYGFTAVSVLVNGAHAAASWNWDFGRFESSFGVLIGVIAPLAFLMAADEVTRTFFTQAPTGDTGDPNGEPEEAVEATQGEAQETYGSSFRWISP